MQANVPTIDMGIDRLGMSVADTFRRKRKITSTTRISVITSVSLTSSTDSWMGSERSNRTCRETEAGSWARKVGSSARTRRATSTVLVPGCRWTAITIARWSTNQAAVLSFSTPSITVPSSCRRTGLPLKYVTMTGS